MSPQVLYELGGDWYATRLDRGWERPGTAEAEQIFARHGLTGAFCAATGMSLLALVVGAVALRTPRPAQAEVAVAA